MSLFGLSLILTSLGCGDAEPSAANNGPPAKAEEGAAVTEQPKLPSRAMGAPKE